LQELSETCAELHRRHVKMAVVAAQVTVL